MQRHPMHLGGGAAPSPQPPSSLFLLKVASSHCHIATKNIRKKKHKKKTKMTEKKQHMQRRPMHLGGGAAPSPQPPSSLFLLKVASSHCHIASKNITKKKHKKKKTKLTKKKQHMPRHPMHLGGTRCAPHQPPFSLFLFKVASSHCRIASKNITKKKHKKKTKNNKNNNTCKDTQCIWGGGAAPSPQKMTEQKTQMQRDPIHLSKNTTERNKKCKNTRCISQL